MAAWEAAGEEHGGGFGNDDDAFADLAAEEVGGGGFAAAGAAGEDDAEWGFVGGWEAGHGRLVTKRHRKRERGRGDGGAMGGLFEIGLWWEVRCGVWRWDE